MSSAGMFWMCTAFVRVFILLQGSQSEGITPLWLIETVTIMFCLLSTTKAPVCLWVAPYNPTINGCSWCALAAPRTQNPSPKTEVWVGSSVSSPYKPYIVL